MSVLFRPEQHYSCPFIILVQHPHGVWGKDLSPVIYINDINSTYNSVRMLLSTEEPTAKLGLDFVMYTTEG